MNTYKDYSTAIGNSAATNAKEILKQDRSYIEAAIAKDYYGTELIQSSKFKDRQEYKILRNIINGFIEIEKTVERLLDMEVYCSKFPFQKSRVTHENYIGFIIESYMNEVYILKERLKKYATVVERIYRKTESAQRIYAEFKELKNDVEKWFSGITNVRGTHVHAARYLDDDLRRLSFISLLARNTDNRYYSNRYKTEFKEIRKKQCAALKKYNKDIILVLDAYFKRLGPIVFEKGNVIYPKKYSA